MGWLLYLFYGSLLFLISRLGSFCFLSSIYTLGGIGKRKIARIYKFSIVIPAYNEEATISNCIESMLDLNYPNYEVVVVDDGSTDKTLELAEKYTKVGVKVIHQQNMGKAKALNTGIENAAGEIIITVDADSRLHPEALWEMAERFSNNTKLGAVAGNVKIDNPSSFLKTLQSLEYITGINLARKSQSILHSVMIIPGAIAALKAEVLRVAGSFSADTFAEDFDVTMEILRKGYQVEYEAKSIAYTQGPNNIEDLLQQRRRWYRGMMQVLAKHQDMYLSRKHGILGLFGVPYMWFEMISSVINISLLIIFFSVILLGGNPAPVILGLLYYWIIITAVSVYAVLLDPHPRIREIAISPTLLFYNIFLDGVRVMAFVEEILNLAMRWEKPRREGGVGWKKSAS